MKSRFFFLTVLLCLAPALFAQQRRFALVIGNQDYRSIEKLANPANDARDIAAALGRLGYQVDLKLNLGHADMGRAVAGYIQRLAGDVQNEGFFWYAGHGVQIDGENYLLPVDINARDSVDIVYGSYPLNRLLLSLEQSARNKVNVVVLDACRNNPFRNMTVGGRGIGRGLTVVNNLPQDLFVLFSTTAGEIAVDGAGGRNSPFAEAFLKHIESREAFALVVSDITRETLTLTGNKQRPFQQGSIISEKYYSLNPAAPRPVSPPAVPPPEPMGDAAARAERGDAYYFRGNYDWALEEYSEAVKINPRYAGAWAGRGNVYNSREEFEKGDGEYTEAARLNPAYGAYHRGYSAWRRGEHDRAIEELSRAIELMPRNVFAYNRRGNAYEGKKDYDRAIADYNEAIRLNPQFAFAYNNRGNAYQNKGDYDRAITDYNEAIRINPQFAMAYNNRGIAYSDKKDYDRAIADYNEAIRINPQFADAYTNRGIAYENKRDYDKAIADYTEAIRINPQYAIAYYNRGNAYRGKKDYDRAIADYTEAIRINPQFVEAYNNRGNSYSDKGDYDKAIADYSEAIRLNPQYALAYNNRGNVYKAKGDQARADADYAQAKRLGYQ